jgi:hypothetical protein
VRISWFILLCFEELSVAPWSLSSKAECELVARRTCLWLVFKVVSGGRLVPTMMVKMTISSKIHVFQY